MSRPLTLAAAVAAASLAVGLFGTTPARADDSGNPEAAAAPNAARIALVQGEVTLKRGDSGDEVKAALNGPVLADDYLSTTGEGSRAEVQFDADSSMRLDRDVAVHFVDLDANAVEAQLAQGTIEVRVLRDGPAPIVDTPSVSIRPDTAGSYRITVDGDGKTLVSVRSGQASVATPKGEITLKPDTTLIADGAPDSATVTYSDAIALDDFDNFNVERDGTETASLDDGNVPQTISYEDFSQYGKWTSDSTYGRVWVPDGVGADWAPYRDGSWDWAGGYGWTWVSYEPWGWAPYHYGRWYHAAFGWCWVPPLADVVPVWSPGLVAFFGFDAGFGSIGWVPLAPYEPYYPWYGWSGGTFGPRVGLEVNVTDITYANLHWGSSLSAAAFTRAGFHRPIAVPIERWDHARLVRAALPIVPTHESVGFLREPSARNVAARFADRTFARNAPEIRTANLAQSRERLQSHADAIREAAPVVRFENAPVTGQTPAGGQARGAGNPWQRFDRTRTDAPQHVPVIDGGTPSYARPSGNQPRYAQPRYAQPGGREYRSPDYRSPNYRSPEYRSPQYRAPQYNRYPQSGGAYRHDGYYRPPSQSRGSDAHRSAPAHSEAPKPKGH